MDWFLSIVRIAGAAFPATAALVQLQSEIDSRIFKKRIERLEDPISHLHSDIPDVARNIYQKLIQTDSTVLEFDENFYQNFSHALAVLESEGHINLNHSIGKKYASSISLIDPSFIMYMCAIAEDHERMETLVDQIDNCQTGEWLDGEEIQTNIDLPLTVIKAVFELFESKGYGVCSQTRGKCMYLGKS